jgi:hypothetical protein
MLLKNLVSITQWPLGGANTTAGGCQCFIFVLVNWDKILPSTGEAQPPEQDF